MSAPSTTPDTGRAPRGDGSPTAGRWVAIIVGVLVIALAAFFGLTRLLLGNDADSGTSSGAAPLELSLGDGDALASCMVFDVVILADMSPAFAATATAVDGETITLAVDHWYAGGDADTVVLHASAGQEALIGGIDFVVGEEYLITATGGSVNYCGYSGPATPELTAAFDEAFGA